MLAGYRQILTDTFDPDEALDLIERDGRDAHRRLRHAPEAPGRRARVAPAPNLSTLRTGVIAAGAASATPIVYRARKVLAPLRHLTAYGMTEVGATISLSFLDSTEAQACEASGAPCEGVEVRVIVNHTATTQPRGTPGEVVVRTDISCRATTAIPSRPRAPSMPTDGFTPAMPASCVRTVISDSSAATRT